MINYYLLNSAFGKHGGEPVGGKPQFINRLVAVPFWTVKSTSYQQHSETGVRLERLSSSPPQLVCSRFRVFLRPFSTIQKRSANSLAPEGPRSGEKAGLCMRTSAKQTLHHIRKSLYLGEYIQIDTGKPLGKHCLVKVISSNR